MIAAVIDEGDDEITFDEEEVNSIDSSAAANRIAGVETIGGVSVTPSSNKGILEALEKMKNQEGSPLAFKPPEDVVMDAGHKMKMGVVQVGMASGSLTLESRGHEVVAKFDDSGSMGGQQGVLDPQLILGVISRRSTPIRSCFNKVLKGNPGLGGRIEVQFTINETGHTEAISIIANTTNSEVLENCIVNTVKMWRFPAPKNGKVTLKYPFIFERTF